MSHMIISWLLPQWLLLHCQCLLQQTQHNRDQKVRVYAIMGQTTSQEQLHVLS